MLHFFLLSKAGGGGEAEGNGGGWRDRGGSLEAQKMAYNMYAKVDTAEEAKKKEQSVSMYAPNGQSSPAQSSVSHSLTFCLWWRIA